MTVFEYDNLPDSVRADALPEELTLLAYAAFVNAWRSDHALAVEVKAVHVYSRKGFMEQESFGKERTSPYGSIDDDVVLQLTIRVPHPSLTRVDGALNQVAALEEDAKAFRVHAERERLEAEIAQAETEAAKAEADAREKRARLEALRLKTGGK